MRQKRERRIPGSIKKILRGGARTSVLISVIIGFLPLVIYSAAPMNFVLGSGLHMINQPFTSNPVIGLSPDDSSIMDFGSAANAPGGNLHWHISTPVFDAKKDFYAFAYVKAPDLGLNEVFFFDRMGAHPMSTYGALPFAQDVTVVEEPLLSIDNFGPFPRTYEILFGAALVDPGEDLLDFNNVYVWYTEATGLGWCYEFPGCSGPKASTDMVDRDTCEDLLGESWKENRTGACLVP